jgi:ssDNA-binding Zn-finger/Zn-ribbon topoisomerase 1
MSRPMAEVTCPQCRTRQEIDPDAEGYRCLVCAATWNFVRCTVCAERFHTRPGARAWTCPNCGTPHGRTRRGVSRVGAPLPFLIGGVVLTGVVAFFLVRSLGSDDGGSTRSPTPSSPSPITDPANKVCGDLGAVQVLRVGALDEAAEALTADADALRAAGEPERADLVDDLVAAVQTYREVAEGGGDTQAATEGLLNALGAVDWC